MNAKELIDILCPEHDRTSCSDDNVSNGFYREEDSTTIESKYFPRCGRCALLEIESGKSTDGKKLLESITIHFKYLGNK